MITCRFCGALAVDARSAEMHYSECEKRPPGVHDVAKVVEVAAAAAGAGIAMVEEGARKIAALVPKVELAAAGLKKALDDPELIMKWFQRMGRG